MNEMIFFYHGVIVCKWRDFKNHYKDGQIVLTRI